MCFSYFCKKFHSLNFEYFIAKRIAPDKSENYARPVIRISYVSIALGLALMIISVAIVVGFKHSISSKIIGFASDLQITAYNNNESLEEQPVVLTDELLEVLNKDPEIVHFQPTAIKAGVLKTKDQIQGIVFKGVGAGYDKSFLENHIVEGRFPDLTGKKSTEVLISQQIADKLNLKTGDNLRAWFVTGTQARGRKFKVSGIYKTSLEEFDHAYIIGDLRQVQKLNNWNKDQVGSIEVMVKDTKMIGDIGMELNRELPFNLRVTTVMDQYPEIFNWLDLLDMNVAVILTLLILVSAITMISTLLVLIIERTNMVGVLKALGTRNRSIRKIFLYKAMYIILKGMFWGNVIGLAFYFIQLYFRPVGLSPEDYYVNYVPVELSLSYFLLLNLGTFVICLLMLVAPLYYITRIEPAKALRYE